MKLDRTELSLRKRDEHKGRKRRGVPDQLRNQYNSTGELKGSLSVDEGHVGQELPAYLSREDRVLPAERPFAFLLTGIHGWPVCETA